MTVMLTRMVASLPLCKQCQHDRQQVFTGCPYGYQGSMKCDKITKSETLSYLESHGMSQEKMTRMYYLTAGLSFPVNVWPPFVVRTWKHRLESRHYVTCAPPVVSYIKLLLHPVQQRKNANSKEKRFLSSISIFHISFQFHQFKIHKLDVWYIMCPT